MSRHNYGNRGFREAPKSEMDSQRELLDALMGINRNQDKSEVEISDYHDDKVCKFYLMGVCPHEMFVNTKLDCGPCSKIHSDILKEDFERRGNDKFAFDVLVERDFTNRLHDMDRSIEKARLRLEAESKLEDEMNPELNPEVIQLTTEIQKTIEKLDNFVRIDDIDKAQDEADNYDTLFKQKQEKVNRLIEHYRTVQQKVGSDVNKKLRVCDICGVFLSIFDSDKRLQDHFLGKQHMGCQIMRDTLEKIKQRREEKRAKGVIESSTREHEPPRRTFDSNQNNYRSQSRDRRPRDRDRERSRSRDRRRSRSNDRRDKRRRDDSRGRR